MGDAILAGNGVAGGDQQLLAHSSDLCHTEIATWTICGLRVAVTEHMIRRNLVGLHQVSDQTAQRTQLGFGGMGHIKIAHQADADAMLVIAIVWGLGMRAPLLLGPAGADFDLAVARVGAVANDKVVAEFIPAFGAVHLVESSS